MSRWVVPLLAVGWILAFVLILVDYFTVKSLLVAILGLILMAACSGAIPLLRPPRPKRPAGPRSDGTFKYYYDAQGKTYVPCFENYGLGGVSHYCILKDGHTGKHSDQLPRGYRTE